MKISPALKNNIQILAAMLPSTLAFIYFCEPLETNEISPPAIIFLVLCGIFGFFGLLIATISLGKEKSLFMPAAVTLLCPSLYSFYYYMNPLGLYASISLVIIIILNLCTHLCFPKLWINKKAQH